MNKTERQLYSRYVRMCGEYGVDPELFQDFTMTLFFSNEQVPLDLERLLKFDDFNFAHDVFGMFRHMDRETATLGGCFVPRCAKPAVPA